MPSSFMAATDPLDLELISRIAAEDADALAALYSRHASAVYSLALRITRDRSLAEEAAQDAFMQVWRTAASFDPSRGGVRTWVLMITRARALDRCRVANRMCGRVAQLNPASEGVLLDPAQPVDRVMARSVEVDAMNGLLGVLPDPDRRLIELAYYQGLSHGQIANALQEPLGTIKTRLRRILTLLKHASDVDRRPPFAWTSPSSTQSNAAVLHNLRILVVDDDVDTLTLVKLVLKRAGAAVSVAGSAAQARKHLQREWPDVILADLDMPVEDGCSLLRYVRSCADGRARRVPAAAFTAHGHGADRLRTVSAGFNAHFLKPIRPATLVAQVASLARSHNTPPQPAY